MSFRPECENNIKRRNADVFRDKNRIKRDNNRSSNRGVHGGPRNDSRNLPATQRRERHAPGPPTMINDAEPENKHAAENPSSFIFRENWLLHAVAVLPALSLSISNPSSIEWIIQRENGLFSSPDLAENNNVLVLDSVADWHVGGGLAWDVSP